MRVATHLTFDRARDQMSALSAKADRLNTQLATNSRLQAPSDDAVAYRALTALKRQSADRAVDKANVDLADAQLSASDTALAGVETQLVRAREIAIAAGNGTMGAAQRASLAAELDVIAEDILRIANTPDSRGAPLFSGASTAPPYVRRADGGIEYTGAGRAGAVPIGDGRTIDALTSGDAIFAGIPLSTGGTGDVFGILAGLSAALRTDGDVGDMAADVAAASASVIDARASIGARGARLELERSRADALALTAEEARSRIEDVDVAATITELQETLTILQATQASFAKLTALSLFDYLS